jgi:hypothetical protein
MKENHRYCCKELREYLLSKNRHKKWLCT